MKPVKISLLAMAVGLLIAGCNGSGTGFINGGTSLTADQQAATNNTAAAMAVVSSAARSFALTGHAQQAPVVPGGNLVRRLPVAPGINVAPRPHAGPTITTVINGNITTVTVDYGSGLTTPDGNTLAGMIIFAINTSANPVSVTVSFTNFSINGNAITGTITFTEQPNTPQQGQTTITEQINNVTYGSLGTLNGTVTVITDGATNSYIISTATLTWTSAGVTYDISASNLVEDPTTGRFEAGSITVVYTPAGSTIQTTLTVTFNSNTPTTGQALVSVDGSTPVVVQFYQQPA